MSFGNLKKWELITLGAAVGIAVVLRILDGAGVISVSPRFAVIALMIFAGFMTLWRPAFTLISCVKNKTKPPGVSAILVDILFALAAEGALLYILFYMENRQ